jgi:hypothetical protein
MINIQVENERGQWHVRLRREAAEPATRLWLKRVSREVRSWPKL